MNEPTTIITLEQLRAKLRAEPDAENRKGRSLRTVAGDFGMSAAALPLR